jgi:hypothetical protein
VTVSAVVCFENSRLPLPSPYICDDNTMPARTCRRRDLNLAAAPARPARAAAAAAAAALPPAAPAVAQGAAEGGPDLGLGAGGAHYVPQVEQLLHALPKRQLG